ncbi:ethanolamine utilization protein EutN [Robertmurraya siralis]|uniref:Ethanolamine utilization protein EutN n=2 Tax=Robertmurraya siralis TaxID=77777 RepID=A0A919WH41_9BACI|nr:ethanolamine utilization protein EutN [Robertmurraya siralis]
MNGKMYVGLVLGSVVATRKSEELVGKKLLIVQQVNPKDGNLGAFEVAVDSVGAGTGEHVLVTKGQPAMYVFGTTPSCIDSAIVGIVDSMEVS